MDWLVEDAKDWWRFWSVRLNAIGLVILAWIQIDPTIALTVWNLMPEAVSSRVPQSFMFWVGVTLFVLAILSRVVRQPKLEKRREG